MSAIQNDELFRVEPAAAKLGIKAKTLRNWIGGRRIGVHRIGRAVRVPGFEINRILEQGFVPAREDRAL